MFSSLTSSAAISNLGTRLNSFRRAITLGDEADDPDHEDCSHISNVLRAYYTEKGRPYPAWLPPNPKAPAPSPARVIATTQIQPGAGSTTATSTYGRGSGGGLGDLRVSRNVAESIPDAAHVASVREPTFTKSTSRHASADGGCNGRSTTVGTSNVGAGKAPGQTTWRPVP
ncbi:hypothetical protein EYZ11_002331 [Aspergillus tanneri]|uniref:Mso1 N-terminal domain-containing protein n=1 Tax=Aspergillus tanneri TaxID=1220188 RepID=A0A4S3JRA5_9EURO|nr:hypothetical protein EYZ11_002331 [Aspergillus tanneri]